MLRTVTMRNTLGRLVRWIVEALDRNLLTVPDFGFDEAQTTHEWAART